MKEMYSNMKTTPETRKHDVIGMRSYLSTDVIARHKLAMHTPCLQVRVERMLILLLENRISYLLQAAQSTKSCFGLSPQLCLYQLV